MKIKHKRKITEKATPADVHQPSMLNTTFLAASYFSTSCHLRKVEILFLYYESHKKRLLFISLLVYFLICSQLYFFYTCLDFRFSLRKFILLFHFPKFQGALYLKKKNQIDPSKVKDTYLA